MQTSETLSGTRPEPTGVMRTCNVCGGEAERVLGGPHPLVRCTRCQLTSLEEFPDARARESHYQEDYYSGQTGARFVGAFEGALSLLRRLRLRAILRREPGPGAILDVGCGRGDLLELFTKRGWRALGTQLSRTAASAARRRRGVDVVCGELPELGLERGQFNVVTFFHVLEHLARPEAYLAAARDLLRDDGLLVVEVPNCSSPGFRLLGSRSFCFDHPHHLLFFTPDSLQLLLHRCGFKVESVSRFSLEYSPYTTLQNLLNLLPGPPSRLYGAFMKNACGLRLRRSPWTWLHALLGGLLAGPALLLSLLAFAFPCGNTLRFYCRRDSHH